MTLQNIQTTATSLRVRMPGIFDLEALDPMLIDLEFAAGADSLVLADDPVLQLRRRLPEVSLMVATSAEMEQVWETVRKELADIIRRANKNPKLQVGLGYGMDCEILPADEESATYLETFRAPRGSAFRGENYLSRAVTSFTGSDSSIVRDRIVFVVPNDPLLFRPWNQEKQLFDQSEVGLYVVEIGLPRSNNPDPQPQGESFFNSVHAAEYAFARTTDELRTTIIEFMERVEQ